MMKKIIKTKKTGFTLVEMTIAIAFISILLITIALVTDDIVSTYRKGIAMKTVNTTGLNLIDEFTNTIAQAPATNFSNLCEIYHQDPGADTEDSPYNNCIKDNGYKFTFQEHLENVAFMTNRKAGAIERVPTFGAFCTGKYSYLWNTGYTMNSETYQPEVEGENITRATLTYWMRDKNNPSGTPIENTVKDFRLLRINDPTRLLCSVHIADRRTGNEAINDYDETANNSATDGEIDFDLRHTILGADYALTEEPVELLSTKNGGLALYSLTIFPPTQDVFSSRLFYSASMVLATISGGVDILANGDHCTVPDNFKTDFNYCAVNKFNFAIRATGE